MKRSGGVSKGAAGRTRLEDTFLISSDNGGARKGYLSIMGDWVSNGDNASLGNEG